MREEQETRENRQGAINWEARFPGLVFRSGRARKLAALTFDDGPDREWNPGVLDALARKRVKATFFCLGNRIERDPNVFKRMIQEGHVVGNHSWSHPLLPKLDRAAIRSELTRTNEASRRIGGVVPALLRPPYGGISDEVVEEAGKLGMKTILWDVDSLDWKGLSADQVTANILKGVHPGAIILQHSAGGEGSNLTGTIKAIPRVVEALEKEGYTLVTVDRLLHLPAYKK